MAATLKTVEGGRVTSMDDAAVRWALSNQNGIIQGCETTLSGNTVTVQPGRIMIYGRLVDITLTEITIPYTTTTQQGAVYVEIQPENAQQPAQIGVMSAEGSVSLTQEDLMNGGTTYQFPLATFTVNVNEVTGFTVSNDGYVPYTELVEEIGNLTERVDQMGDYVVSHNTQDSWIVRKWNSGFCELWRTVSVEGVNIETAAGNLYYSSDLYDVALPFTMAGYAFASLTSGNSAIIVTQNSRHYDKIQMRFATGRTMSNETFSIRCYIRSTWK